MTRAETEALWVDASRKSADIDLGSLDTNRYIFARMVTAHWAERLERLAESLDLPDYIARGRHTTEAQLVYDVIEEMEAEAE